MVRLAAIMFALHLGYAPTVFFLGPPEWSGPAYHARPVVTWTWRYRC